MTQQRILRVFISSPSDVRPERLVAERVVARLGREFAYHFRVEPVMWEREPLVASAHFQENITRPRDTDIVVVVLWSRLGVALPVTTFPGPLTSKPVTGTEWEFEDALKSHRERKSPDLLMYRKRAPIIGSLEDEAAVQQHLAQKRLVEQFMKYWFIDQDRQSYTAAFHEFSDVPAFEDMLETHLRELLRQRLTTPNLEVVAAGIQWHQGSPFRGLLSFELEHSPIFFGRTRVRNELRELLGRQAERGSAFVLVVGASGAGKSSVVKAGLLPDIKLQGMIGRVALVRHAIFRPSDGEGDLLAKLAAAIMSTDALPELPSLQYDVHGLAKLLAEAPAQAGLPIRQGLAAASRSANLTEIAEARLLIVVDQLEEIFTHESISEGERDRFVAALEALAKCGLVWVVATMRSDFFDRLEKLPRLVALSAGEARYILAQPEPAEIAQIIRQPAREAGLTFEVDGSRGLSVDELIRQAAERDLGALPLLSFLLDQLWQRRDSNGVLTFAGYIELGGLEGALGLRAEEVFVAQSPEVQAALPAVLRTLVSVGQGDEKASVSARSAPISMFPPGTPARTLIDAFLDPKARLLVADDNLAEPASGGAPRRGRALVRVAHEALLSHWPRAKAQISADSRDLELLGRLENDAERWQAAQKKHRDSLVLPSGLPLAQARDLIQRWSAGVPAAVTEFVRQSRRVAARRRRRLTMALVGAVMALPIIAGIAWTVLVWRGVQAVEASMDFVPIPAGCFVMGSPSTDSQRHPHEVEHNVCVPAFELAKYPVTQEQWRLVMVENPDPFRFKNPRNPVESVSWYDARAFAWRMSFFGKHKYRLPSEAEWEYAARAGTTTVRFWGDAAKDGCAYANMRDQTLVKTLYGFDEAIIACEDGFAYPAPVGSFKPNPFGLYDMLGNVAQWTADCYGDYANAPNDGRAEESEGCANRVVRGSSWNGKPWFTRSASRDYYMPVNRNDVTGFRLAR
ncbi:MAG: SUMF1/EgtB/PvdO family nonheme iron enzyme [Xanthobacteraceae bacterium]